MQIAFHNDFIIIDHYKYPITNENINYVFSIFQNIINQYYSPTYDSQLIRLADNILDINNERIIAKESNDIYSYIEASKTIWSKLQNFKIHHDFYITTIDDKNKEQYLINIYKQNNDIYDFDSLKVLKIKKETLINYFIDIENFYNQILIRIDSYKFNNLFQVKAYRNKIFKSLKDNLEKKENIINMFDNEIEKLKNINHCRAVLKQCIGQNFGFSKLHLLEESLIYKIDSYIN